MTHLFRMWAESVPASCSESESISNMTRNIDFKRMKLIIEHAWLPINWSALTVLEVKMQNVFLNFKQMKLKIIKLFNNFWQFCLTWNQIPFIISISRVQAPKTKSMPQYFGKNKEEIAKGTCVEDLKYRLLYAVPTLSH